ncbi:MAG: DUF4032 domain-containing protein [Nitrosopumilaceae archaeon]|nr:DUF4032 domain-containing protein [Nitrosopumilaceae archaeon]
MNRYPLEDSLLYKKYVEDKRQIEEHKWYLSERAGKDVGWEKALLDWLINKKCQDMHSKNSKTCKRFKMVKPLCQRLKRRLRSEIYHS